LQLGCEEESSNHVQNLLESTIGFAHAMAKRCMLGQHSIAVELMNPAPLQRMVDSGEFTKLAITKAIVECLMRCAFVSYVDEDGKLHCNVDENVKVFAMLSQHVSTIAGVDLLCGREPHTEKAFTQLVQASGRAPQLEWAIWEVLELKLVKDVEKEDLHFLSGDDRQCGCARSFKWCEKCADVSWVKFLQEFKRYGAANTWFEWDGAPFHEPDLCRFAVAIHAE